MYLEKVGYIFGEDICGIHYHFCVAKKEFDCIVSYARAREGGEGRRKGGEGGRRKRGREGGKEGGRA